MVDAGFGTIQQLDPEAHELDMFAYCGFSEETIARWNRVDVETSSSCARALRTEERVVIPDVETCEFIEAGDDLEAFNRVGIRSMQSTPLISRSGELLGMLSTHWTDSHEPSERDRHVLDVIARQVADLMQQRAAFEALHESEERQRFLVELNDQIRPLTDPVAVQRAAMKHLAEHLDVIRASYFEIDADQNGFVQAAGYETEGTVELPERMRISDFGTEIEAEYRANRTVVVDDTETDLQLESQRQAHRAIGVRAWVGVPLVKKGRLVVVLGVHHSTPRNWTNSEVRLIEEVAERTWAAVERAHAEQARRESEERFRAVANLVPSLLWSNDPEGSTFWYNQQWLDYTGQTMADAADYGWLEAIHPEDREQSLENFQSAVDAGEPLRQEHRIRRRDGEYHWFLVRARPVRNGGEISRWFGAATDIHDQREMRATLERLNAVTRDLLNTESVTFEDRVAGLVREILDVEYTALWRYDDRRGDLEEHAVDTAPDVDPDSISVSAELSELVWQTFVGSDVDVATGLDGLDDTWGSLESHVLVPLGRHGVVCLGSTRAGTFDERTVDLVEMVAATARPHGTAPPEKRS